MNTFIHENFPIYGIVIEGVAQIIKLRDLERNVALGITKEIWGIISTNLNSL